MEKESYALPSTRWEVGEKAILLLERIIDGGSCGGFNDCILPSWLHDMGAAVLEEHAKVTRGAK